MEQFYYSALSWKPSPWPALAHLRAHHCRGGHGRLALQACEQVLLQDSLISKFQLCHVSSCVPGQAVQNSLSLLRIMRLNQTTKGQAHSVLLTKVSCGGYAG